MNTIARAGAPAHTPLRIAVVSTPRSGNTWIRHLIAAAYGLSESSAHELGESDWRELPVRHAVQIHHAPDEPFLARLRDYDVVPVTIARHPFDVLVSILQFAISDLETHRWLGGRGGDESGIFGTMPRSRAFVDYATGPRAAALLAVTRDWWRRPGVVRVRYEDVVTDPAAGLAALSTALGSSCDWTMVADGLTLDKLRLTSVNNHFWQGRPGLWRELIPPAEAREIAAAHADSFAALGYTCDPDPYLDPATADRNWVRLGGAALATAVRRASAGHAAQLNIYRASIEQYEAEVSELRRFTVAREAELDLLQRRVADLEQRSPSIETTHNQGLSVTRLLRNVRDCFPRNKSDAACSR